MSILDPNSDCINLLLQFRKINLGWIWYGNPRIYLVYQQYLVRISQWINLVIQISWNRLYSFHSPLWRVSTIPTWYEISKKSWINFWLASFIVSFIWSEYNSVNFKWFNLTTVKIKILIKFDMLLSEISGHEKNIFSCSWLLKVGTDFSFTTYLVEGCRFAFSDRKIGFFRFSISFSILFFYLNLIVFLQTMELSQWVWPKYQSSSNWVSICVLIFLYGIYLKLKTELE